MNCETAIELLPWLLNGTLEATERQQVQQHLASCAACRQALAETGAAAAIFDWHPPAAELVALAGGEPATPTAPASAETEEHVAGCPRCAAELELLRTGRLLVQSAGNVALLHAPAGKPTERQRDHRDDRANGRAWRRTALAAGLGGILALGGWLETARVNRALEGRLAASTASTAGTASTAPAAAAQPRGTANAPRVAAEADVSIAELHDRVQRGGEPAMQEISLSRGAALMLHRSHTVPSYPSYELTIEDEASGKRVGGPWGIKPKDTGSDEGQVFQVYLHGSLPPGAYTLQLLGVSPGQAPTRLDTYAFRVTS